MVPLLDRPLVQFGLALAAVLILPLVMRSGTLASEILIYGLAVAACNLLLGYTGLLSFGQGIFFGLGSYVAGLGLVRAGLTAPPGDRREPNGRGRAWLGIQGTFSASFLDIVPCASSSPWC